MNTFLGYTWKAFKDIVGAFMFFMFWGIVGGFTVFAPMVAGGLIGGAFGMIVTCFLWIVLASLLFGFYQWLQNQDTSQVKRTWKEH